MTDLWHKLKSFAEQHPYGLAAIIVVIGGLIIYYLYSGGSSSNNSAAANTAAQQSAAIQAGDALQAAQLGYQSQLGMANIQAGVLNTAANDQLSAIESQTAAAVTENGQNTNTQLAALENTNFYASEASARAEQVANAQINSSTALAGEQLNTDVSLANIAANESLAKFGAILPNIAKAQQDLANTTSPAAVPVITEGTIQSGQAAEAQFAQTYASLANG